MQLEGGEIGDEVLPLQSSKWRFFERRTVMESRVCLREKVGPNWSDRPMRVDCAVLPGFPEAALTIS